MPSETLIKLSGIGLLCSGFLVALGFSIHPHDPLGANFAGWIAGHILIILGFSASLLGLFGLYAVVARETGVAGLLGFLLASVSLILYLGKLYWSGFIYPLVIAEHPAFIEAFGFHPGAQPTDPLVRVVFYLGPLVFAAGYMLLGGAMLRAGLFPRVPVGLVIVGALLVGLWPLLPAAVQGFSVIVSLIFAVGIGWIGYVLMRDKHLREGGLVRTPAPEAVAE